MEARIGEVIMLGAVVIALFTAMFILPRLERIERHARERSAWMIIDREFIDLSEEMGNG